MKDKTWLVTCLILLGLCGFYLYMRHNSASPLAPVMDYKPSQEKIFTEPVKPVTPEQPSTPTTPPTPPVRPSTTFMRGYWDGYNGTWLGPVRWLASDDYRQGWSLGNSDRKKGIKRYPPEMR
jgi:hypothetical protein